MKTLKNAISILVLIIMTSCSKDNPVEPTSEPVAIVDNRLVLPATLENNILFDIPDAINTTGYCGNRTTPGIVESKIVIDKDGEIGTASKISIELNLSHPNAGDLMAELIAPSGESCALIKRIGANSDTDCGTNKDFVLGNKLLFNSAVPINVFLAGSTTFPAGNYAPLIGTSTFPTNVPAISLNDFFTGKKIKGTWKIKMYDFGVDDVGKLIAWKIKFEAGALK
jgi:subtilisin-like proprotein convertase family protein